MEFLVSYEVDINRKDEYGYTAIFYAVKSDIITVCEILLENGAKINQEDSNGATVLKEAAMNCDYSMVEFLIKCNMDVNHKDNSGKTAIYYACLSDDIVNALVLLENGANPNIGETYDSRPLYICKTKGYKILYDILIEFGAKLG